MKGMWEKFREWHKASLGRRIVVSVAGFSLLTCLAIGIMSLVAVSAARAVLPQGPSAQASAQVEAGQRDAAKRGPRDARNGKATVEPAKDEDQE